MSKKNLDNKDRFRGKIVAFRMSDAESEALEHRWRLLGYRTKQDYLIDAVLKNEVVAVGNAYMFYQFKTVLGNILAELKRIQNSDELDEELLTPVEMMLQIMEAFRPEEKEEKEKAAEMSKEQYQQMLHLRKLQGIMRKEQERKERELKDEQNHSDS